MIETKFLYKYCGLNLNSLRILIDSKLYFGQPINFNDPLEGDFEFIAINQLPSEDILASTFDRKILDSSIFSLGYLNNTVEDSLRRIVKTKFGISCFSSINDNPLMWAHYADSRKGICLEFDANKLLANLSKHYEHLAIRVAKIKYTNKLPKIKARLEANFLRYGRTNSKLYRTKQTHWKYEKEWRFIVNIDDDNYSRAFFFGGDCITGIILGDQMNIEDQKMINTLIQSSSKLQNIKVSRLTLDSAGKRFVVLPDTRLWFDVQPTELGIR